MLYNLGLFLSAVADHWLFWIGLVLTIEPYLERAAPRTWEAIRWCNRPAQLVDS